MDDRLTGSQTASRTGVAALSVGVFAVLCCAALALLAALLGGIAVGSVLGVGAGVLAVAVVLALSVARSRRPSADAPPDVASRGGGET